MSLRSLMSLLSMPMSMPQGADAIGEALKVSRAPLTTLDLSGNKVSPPARYTLEHVAKIVAPSLALRL
jgi:hypothetical protein